MATGRSPASDQSQIFVRRVGAAALVEDDTPFSLGTQVEALGQPPEENLFFPVGLGPGVLLGDKRD